jgi:uncharacterized phage protein (TIGR01671 family)
MQQTVNTDLILRTKGDTMEIPKYRAWVTGTENVMYQPREVWINNGEVWLSNSKGLPEKKVAADKVILSRATGYKDQNGVEIFKGDILKINDTYAEIDYDGSCFLVSFIEKVKENQVDKNFLVILTVKELVEDYKVTVIGNVYANPELKELVKG